jgi:hypothetical protein
MIKEIKRKKEKFGAIITTYSDVIPNDVIEGHRAYSAYVEIHTQGVSSDKGQGVRIIGHKTTPKLKMAIGRYITHIRAGDVVVFKGSNVKLSNDGIAIYDYIDKLKMERTYGFYLGDANKPDAVGISPSLMEHLFHGCPESLEMSGDWVTWVHNWMLKNLMNPGRYFDGNGLVNSYSADKASLVSEPIPATAKDASEYTISENTGPKPSDFVGEGKYSIELATGKVSENNVVEPKTKKKPGRPKKK